MSALLPNYFM